MLTAAAHLSASSRCRRSGQAHKQVGMPDALRRRGADLQNPTRYVMRLQGQGDKLKL